MQAPLRMLLTAVIICQRYIYLRTFLYLRVTVDYKALLATQSVYDGLHKMAGLFFFLHFVFFFSFSALFFSFFCPISSPYTVLFSVFWIFFLIFHAFSMLFRLLFDFCTPRFIPRFFFSFFFFLWGCFILRLCEARTRLFLDILLKSQNMSTRQPLFRFNHKKSSSNSWSMHRVPLCICCKHSRSQRNQPCAKEQCTYVRTIRTCRSERDNTRKQTESAKAIKPCSLERTKIEVCRTNLYSYHVQAAAAGDAPKICLYFSIK